MKDIAIYKLTRIEQALETLAHAVQRLDRAARERLEAEPEAAFDAEMEAELEALRADYENLRTVSQVVSDRLDGAIHRLRDTLDSP